MLTATQTGDPPPGSAPLPPAAQRDLDAWQQQDWMAAHDRLAALSTRGQNRPISGAGHYIHLDKPPVVIAAIEEVLDAAGR